jgi:hypothetical protein
VTILLLKLTISPAVIAFASYLARRFGPAIGGWLIGLPVSAGPVALFLDLDHGASFTAKVATGFVAGVSAQAAFVIAYVALARRGAAWPAALAAGTAAFAFTGVLLELSGFTLPVLLACALAMLWLALKLVPKTGHRRELPRGRGDLVIRMAAATVLVLAITAFATTLGAGFSGVATTFPLLSTILAVSLHRADPLAAVAVYRGLLTGLFALIGFAATLALVLVHLSLASAFALAVALTLSIQLGSLRTVQRSAGARA